MSYHKVFVPSYQLIIVLIPNKYFKLFITVPDFLNYARRDATEDLYMTIYKYTK